MFRLAPWIVALSISALAFGDEAKLARVSDDDRAIVTIALQDFFHWDEATFGHLQGALAVKAKTQSSSGGTVEELRDLAPNIRARISDEVAKAYLERNKVAVRSADLVKDSPWVRLLPANKQNATAFDLRPNAKAVGSFTLPGIDVTGTEALIQIHHSWSIHGAIVTYVLAKQDGTWRIVARDQTVFL